MKKILLFILVFLSLIFNSYSVNINSCQALSTPGEYRLNQSILNHGSSICFDITSNNVTLDCQGYQIDSTDGPDYGIRITRGSQQTTNITVRNCVLSDWRYYAFYMNNANGNLIENINLSSNIRESFIVSNSDNNEFNNLDLFGTGDGNSYPFQLSNSDFNNFTNIDFLSNGRGMSITTGSNNIFDNIYMANMAKTGFYIAGTSNNNVLKNSLIKNMGTSTTPAITLWFGTGNTFYNNVLNNTINAIVYNGMTSSWDNGSIGNYWYTPSGTGYSEYCADLDSNGFCDAPYAEKSYSLTDNYPFAKVSGQGPTYNVNDCRVFDVPGIYTMTQDIINSNTPYCIKLNSNNVTLNCQGYTIDGDDSVSFGVFLSRGAEQNTNVTISNCPINDWSSYGLYMVNSNGNLIENTNITSGNSRSFVISNSDQNQFNNLKVIGASDPNSFAFEIANSQYNNFTNLEAISLRRGPYISSSNNNIFDNAYISSMTANGIYIAGLTSSNNVVKNSHIRASGATSYGINVWWGNGNQFYNNILNNTQNGVVYNGMTSSWDNGSLGNFWYTPTGTGFSDTCPDNDMDNLCDNPPYTGDGATDNYPQTVSYPSYPYYLSPTPAHKSKISSNSIIFRVGNASSASWINLTIDNINYSLTNQGAGIWEYSFDSSNITTSTQKIFKVYYAGSELEQRTITIYPTKNNSQKVPSIGIGSLIISVMIFILALLI